MRRRDLIASVAGVVAAWPLGATAQTETVQSETVQTWPTRPVRLIVGFGPGGPTDLIARLIAQPLSEKTGKNFIVENVPGAGGNVGAARAAKSAPDGYTFLVTGGNLTNNQFLFAEPGYALKDFDAVTLVAATPVVLAVNPSVPANTVKELVAWIRVNPGKESYASPGTGTPPQLVGALFQHALQLDLVHVPFDGGGTAVQATVGGHTPISFGAMAPAVPLIKAGQLRALAVTGKERSPTDIIVGSLAQPDVKAKLAAMAYAPIGSAPQACEDFFKSELAKWGDVIKQAGLKQE
jgi:tripartite-type tricarboxylate transporter receptor subunit TctC